MPLPPFLWQEGRWLCHAPGKLGTVVDAVNEAQAKQRGGIALGVSADLVRALPLHEREPAGLQSLNLA